MSPALRVLVVDDEPLARQRIRRLLGLEPDVADVIEASTGADAVDALAGSEFDLLFLDIRMPDMDGFDVLAAAPEHRIPVTVFVTAHDDRAIDAFDAGAIDYLLKPFTEARFRVTLERARTVARSGSGEWRSRLKSAIEREPIARFLVKKPGGTIVVPTAEIEYLTAARNAVRLHLGAAVHRMRGRLTDLEARLDPARFVRIHRSTIVNLDRVIAIEPLFSGDAQVVLRHGARVRVSRTHRRAFEERLRARH